MLKIWEFINVHLVIFEFTCTVVVTFLTLLTFFKIDNWKRIKNKYKRYIKFIAFLLFCFFLFALGSISRKSPKTREKIVVLLPLNKSENSSPPYQDGKRQGFGFIDLLEKETAIQNKYEIILVNHKMDKDYARSKVKEELCNGTKYFVSTMSEVSKELSSNFEQLVKENYNGEKTDPKLIMTVSSSNELILKNNLIYRFYIRSEDEAKLLADYFNKNISHGRLISIVVEDNYGNTARDLFSQEASVNFDKNIWLGKNWVKDKVKEKIASQLNSINS